MTYPSKKVVYTIKSLKMHLVTFTDKSFSIVNFFLLVDILPAAAEQAAPQEVHGVHSSPGHEVAVPQEGFERQLRGHFHARVVVLEI